jgi:hypothetical protein
MAGRGGARERGRGGTWGQEQWPQQQMQQQFQKMQAPMDFGPMQQFGFPPPYGFMPGPIPTWGFNGPYPQFPQTLSLLCNPTSGWLLNSSSRGAASSSSNLRAALTKLARRLNLRLRRSWWLHPKMQWLLELITMLRWIILVLSACAAVNQGIIKLCAQSQKFASSARLLLILWRNVLLGKSLIKWPSMWGVLPLVWGSILLNFLRWWWIQ